MLGVTRCSLVALLLVALLAPSLALKCYKCEDCEKGMFSTPAIEECSGISGMGNLFDQVCMKVEMDDRVSKSCSSQILCETASAVHDAAEKSVPFIMQELLATQSTLLEIDNIEVAETYCCNGDLCNASPAPLAGLGLLLAPALAYLAA